MTENRLSRREFLKVAGMVGLLVGLPGGRKLARAASAARTWTVTGHEFAELASFDQTMKDFMQARAISGGALAVTRDSRLMLARGYTYSDDPEDLIVQPASLFRLASVSKPLTAAAVMRLVQDARLELAAKVGDLLALTPPAGGTADPRLAEVTVRQLLQHLGGFDGIGDFDPMFNDFAISAEMGAPLPVSQANIITSASGRALKYDPGTTYAYSNYGYCLLGRLIEKVTGRPYQDYVKDALFRPLAVSQPALGRTLAAQRRSNEVKYHSQYTSTSVFDNSFAEVPAPYGGWNLENMDAHGGWLASAVDLARFAASFDDPAACPILNAASIAAMFALPENIAPEDYTPGDFYYACGWMVRDAGGANRNTWHTGGLDGTFTLLVRRGFDKTNWCALFNQRDDSSGLDYMDIDLALHVAANAVTAWPEHDLFGEYLRREVFLPVVEEGVL